MNTAMTFALIAAPAAAATLMGLRLLSAARRKALLSLLLLRSPRR